MEKGSGFLGRMVSWFHYANDHKGPYRELPNFNTSEVLKMTKSLHMFAGGQSLR